MTEEAKDSNTTENGEKKINEDQMIPKHRFDAVNEKRKSAETELKAVAEDLKKEVSEEYQDLIPDLPPGQLIKWLQNATSKGLFDPKSQETIDSKRPGGKSPTNFENMTPQQIMETGYKTK